MSDVALLAQLVLARGERVPFLPGFSRSRIPSSRSPSDPLCEEPVSPCSPIGPPRRRKTR